MMAARLFTEAIETWLSQINIKYIESRKVTLSKLTDLQRQLWEKLSVYRLPFDNIAASYMASGETGTDVEEELQKLVDSLLLEANLVENKRYFQFVQPIDREYALYCATEKSSISIAHQQAIDYYQSISRIDINSFETAQPYLELFYHHCELSNCDTALDVLWQVDNFLRLQGYYTTLRDAYQQLQIVYQQASNPDQARYGSVLSNLGNAYQSLGQYREAIAFQEQALAICQNINYQQLEGSCLDNLGIVYQSLGQYQEAIAFQEQALVICQDINYRQGEASCLSNLGIIYQSLGQYQEAIAFQEQALAICQNINYQQLEGSCLDNLGIVYQSLGQYQEAIAFQEQALVIFRDIGYRQKEAICLMNLMIVYRKCSRIQESLAVSYQAGLILQELELPLEAMPYAHWLQSLIRFAKRGKLVLSFIVGIIAFPISLITLGLVMTLIFIANLLTQK